MGVSVEKIMKLGNFSQAATLIAGETGINNTVTFITVSETPPIKWNTLPQLRLFMLTRFAIG